jgi:hypothetical protein
VLFTGAVEGFGTLVDGVLAIGRVLLALAVRAGGSASRNCRD